MGLTSSKVVVDNWLVGFVPFWAWSMEEVNYRAITEFLFCSLVHTLLSWVVTFPSFVPS